jgi:hypothetical protein
MHTLSLLLYVAGCCLIAATKGQARDIRRGQFSSVQPSFTGPEPQSEGLFEPLILLEDVPSQPIFETLSSAVDPAENSQFIKHQRENAIARDDGRNFNRLQPSVQFQPKENSVQSPAFDVFQNSGGFFQTNERPQIELESSPPQAFQHGNSETGQSSEKQLIGNKNLSTQLFSFVSSSSGNNFPKLDISSNANTQRTSSIGGVPNFNFITDGGSNERKMFGGSEDSSSALPQSFTPGVPFVPPPYDPELDKRERTESNFLGGLDPNAAVAIDRADCIAETLTVSTTFTSLIPVTTEIISTVSLTSAFTHTRTEIATVRSTRTLTNSVDRTHVATVFSTVHRISTQTKFVSPTTLLSTFTSVVTDYVDKVVVSTQTDTVVMKTTSYVTITDSRFSTTTVPVLHYSTAYAQIPAFIRSFPLTKTETVTEVSTLPAQIVYNSQTLQKTETLTATQTLQPKTVIRTKTLIVPSYSTIYSTSTQTRTKTLRSTVPVIQTTTATAISSVFRVGVAANTEYSTVTETVSNVQYFTTQVPKYITVSITNNIPTTTTRTTTIYGGIQRTVTVQGAVLTEYHTHTSYFSVYKTVTNTLTTPIVYATQTVTLNCPQKK